jgi:hypothetical protein
MPRHRHGAVEFGGLAQCLFGVVISRSASHQTSVDDEDISTRVVLQQLDRPPHHIRQGWLIFSFVELVLKRERTGCECSKDFCPAPGRDCLQFHAGRDNVEPVSAHFEEKISIILPAPAFCGADKIAGAAAHHYVDLLAIPELRRNTARVAAVWSVRVKRCATWVGQFYIGDKAGGSAACSREF